MRDPGFGLLGDPDHRSTARRGSSTTGMPRRHADRLPFTRHLWHLTFEDTDVPIGRENRENLAVLHCGEITRIPVPCSVYRRGDFMFIEQRR